MTSQPDIRIAMVSIRVPVDMHRRSPAPDDPHVYVELHEDLCRVWDSATYTDCGTDYRFTGDQLNVIDMPHFPHVYRCLVDRYAANRTNPLGRFLETVVKAMDSAIAERDGSRVYFARAGTRIKIGWSRNVGSRIAQLQTGNAEPVRLIATTVGSRQLERQLHERFAHARVSGEWFEATADLMAYIGSVCDHHRRAEQAAR